MNIWFITILISLLIELKLDVKILNEIIKKGYSFKYNDILKILLKVNLNTLFNFIIFLIIPGFNILEVLNKYGNYKQFHLLDIKKLEDLNLIENNDIKLNNQTLNNKHNQNKINQLKEYKNYFLADKKINTKPKVLVLKYKYNKKVV